MTVAGRRAAPDPRFRVNGETTVLTADFARRAGGDRQELARRGHIPIGYYKDPEKTAATFPVIDGVRWAVPGDMATVEADGTITVFGRGSVSINTGGEKVYPEEVTGGTEGRSVGHGRGGRRPAGSTAGANGSSR